MISIGSIVRISGRVKERRRSGGLYFAENEGVAKQYRNQLGNLWVNGQQYDLLPELLESGAGRMARRKNRTGRGIRGTPSSQQDARADDRDGERTSVRR